MEFVLELQNQMAKNNYLLAIRDNFENILSKSILKMTERRINAENLQLNVKNRVFGAIVECVQNICNTSNNVDGRNSLLLLNKSNDGFRIVAGTIFNDFRKSRFQKHLTDLMNATDSEIKEIKKRELKEYDPSNENSREILALIDLFTRSGGKISYSFHQLSDENTYFILEIDITVL